MSEILDYEGVLEAYQASLITVLRGFSAGVPFLETWVPDEDHGYSLLGIFEAARESGLPGLDVQLTTERLESIGSERLLALLAELGTVSLSGGRLSVSFGESTAAAESARREFIANTVSRHVEQMVEEVRLPESFALTSLYLDRLRQLGTPLLHRTDQCDGEGPRVERLGVSLQVQLSGEQFLIERAQFSGVAEGDTAMLLEFCCRWVEGLPLYEAADHAVIAMEARLRDRSQPSPAGGIVLAEWSVPGFSLINGMLRELWKKAGKPQNNFFEAPTAEKWRKSSDEGRITKLEESLARHRLAESTVVVRVEGQRRVVVAFRDESLSNSQRQQALLELERHFKEDVEPGLHLYLEPKPDKNKLRQQKGIRL